MPSWQLTTRLPMLRKGRFPNPLRGSVGSDGPRRAHRCKAAMQIQQNANRPVSPRDQARASEARLPSSACRGQLGPAPLAGLFLFFDPLPIVARYALAPISIDPNTVFDPSVHSPPNPCLALVLNNRF